MTPAEVRDELKRWMDQEVLVGFTDGKTEKVKVLFMSDTEEDFIFDFVPKRDYAALAKWTEVKSITSSKNG